MISGNDPRPEGEGARPAPAEFPEALRWVNRREAPRLDRLRGQVVLLLFWNDCSTSSTNLLAELRVLERKLPGEFVTLSVHTPRYPAQGSDEAVLKAAHRHRLHAPIANDSGWLAWNRFGIQAWPTAVIIDTHGGVAARLIGEGCGGEIEDAVLRLRDELPATANTGAADDPETHAEPDAPLAFPAHVLATETQLFISDAGHHRVLECSHDGRVMRQFGSGTPGHWDGHLSACGLQFPQGLAIDRDALYVADAGNHCVRRVRLASGEVETILGSGRPGYRNVEEQGGGLRVAINAPHALAVEGDALFVAATGQHQILKVELHEQRVRTIAGDGRSDLRDGIGGQSSLSQPMALALMPGQLLVADAGSNAIRRLRFADLALATLAGSSPWEPGNSDGSGRAARMAYPCGLAADGTRVFVADTCNDRLCTLDPYRGEITALQFDHPLHGPQGLSFAARALWVADRDKHAILRIDPEHGTCERIAVDE